MSKPNKWGHAVEKILKEKINQELDNKFLSRFPPMIVSTNDMIGKEIITPGIITKIDPVELENLNSIKISLPSHLTTTNPSLRRTLRGYVLTLNVQFKDEDSTREEPEIIINK